MTLSGGPAAEGRGAPRLPAGQLSLAGLYSGGHGAAAAEELGDGPQGIGATLGSSFFRGSPENGLNVGFRTPEFQERFWDMIRMVWRDAGRLARGVAKPAVFGSAGAGRVWLRMSGGGDGVVGRAEGRAGRSGLRAQLLKRADGGVKELDQVVRTRRGVDPFEFGQDEG